MKHHIAIKFLAVALCALALLAAAGSTIGVIGLTATDLYDNDFYDVYESELEGHRNNLAASLAGYYASMELGGCSEQLAFEYYGSWLSNSNFRSGFWFYSVQDENGIILENTYSGQSGVEVFEITPYWGSFLCVAAEETEATTPNPKRPTGSETGRGDNTDIVTAEATSGPEAISETFYYDYYDTEQGSVISCLLYHAAMPEYTVTLYLLPDAYLMDQEWTLLELLWQIRYNLFGVLGVSLLVFAVLAVYLCCAAGRRPGCKDVLPAGLNAMPLDLYGAIVSAVLWLMAFVVMEAFPFIYRASPLVGILVLAICSYVTCLTLVGFCFAFAAQSKMRGGYWWRHSLIGLAILKGFGAARWCWRWLVRIGRLLPLMWRWVLIAASCGLLLIVSVIIAVGTGDLLFMFLMILAIGAVVLYATYAYGILLKGARRMAKGDLNQKISTQYLFGSFRECAEQLNALADVASIAAEKHLKSERMKTELITNVSHDIKTPLTSIINYVDLMKKPHDPADDKVYLDVLDRQSQRLKKLIDDLMEMSKASTGNLSVSISQLDAAEAVNQALGEFADKLDAADLHPVFRHPEEPILMLADGRLVWRVLSNILSNAVKYALPGTRLYVDLIYLNGNAVISVKNISREELNVGAEELMERFVRGDTSRNTEGSGLGLNIAKSLMELQGGQLHLLVDGDLFKVTLIFPTQ